MLLIISLSNDVTAAIHSLDMTSLYVSLKLELDTKGHGLS